MPEKEKHTDISPWTQQSGHFQDFDSDQPNLLQLSSLSKNPVFQTGGRNRQVSSFASNHIYSLVAKSKESRVNGFLPVLTIWI